MENQSFGQRLKQSTYKIVRRLLIFSLLIGLAIFSFFYFGTYESGVLAGKVLRITEKGVIFKTHEGKINLESFGALKGTNPIAETFDFSVENSEVEVIKQLQEVALTGERVNLKFEKRYMAFFWRGDTKYFVTEVERQK
ncbi:MAG: 6-phosphogluconate dehydrogenase [Cytophagales bacterium]|jgi:hypothetical protein|nr:6-phosphogluconate dehydrogenase [Cytophagales bacterium]MCE2894146.1 hypothetical protein [Flammeovirgaceae bacterium]MCA6366811.1 6-phosphogluconate dehydrogenase [Cytophagales bacterium]MCA6370867.1 6-phosphogluconate dehydrogenase [Cytophagales bacterium]MCA6375284.1 6-phosphogluconate dehydrogenase [Cytophagales bacterium]